MDNRGEESAAELYWNEYVRAKREEEAQMATAAAPHDRNAEEGNGWQRTAGEEGSGGDGMADQGNATQGSEKAVPELEVLEASEGGAPAALAGGGDWSDSRLQLESTGA